MKRLLPFSDSQGAELPPKRRNLAQDKDQDKIPDRDQDSGTYQSSSDGEEVFSTPHTEDSPSSCSSEGLGN